MAFTDKLLLWLHIAFAIFTIGPVTVTTSVTPRYIRAGDIPVLRFLNRTTRIFGLLTIGVFLFGAVLGRDRMAEMWLTASMTLFIVAFVLLFALVERDQRKAVQKLLAKQNEQEAAEEAAAAATAEAAGDGTDEESAEKPETAAAKAARKVKDTDVNVQTARIASLSGAIALIWLVILVLMVWGS